jgi:hypothetical protein
VNYKDPNGREDCGASNPVLSMTQYIALESAINASIARYNKMVTHNANTNYSSTSFLQNHNNIAGASAFGAAQGPFILASGSQAGNYYEVDHHSGNDITGSGNWVSPLYLQVVDIKDHRITMNVIGTDRNISILHNNPAELTARWSKGDIIKPGDVIAPYPNASYGWGTGPHGHIQESAIINGQRTIINPDTHQVVPGQTYRYRVGTPSTEPGGQVTWQSWKAMPVY